MNAAALQDSSGTVTLLSEALRHAAEGIAVFPLVPWKGDGSATDGKKPAVKWKTQASTDLAQINAWFGPRGRYARAGLGLRMGATRTNPDTGATEYLIALDIDMESHGKDGVGSLRAACEVRGWSLDQFATRCQRTASGGFHALYWAPTPLKDGADVLGERSGVDIKRKGYIVAAPTVINGRPYSWMDPNIPIACMGDLAELFPVDARPTPASTPVPLDGIDTDRAQQRSIEYLATAPRSVKGAGGDQCAYTVAAALMDCGLDQAQTLDLMLSEHWDEGCGWSPDKLAVKVANAATYRQEAIGSKAPEAVFASSPLESPSISAQAWTRDYIEANPQKLYQLRRHDHEEFLKLAQQWDMLGVLESETLPRLVTAGALEAAGIANAQTLAVEPTRLEQPDVQRALAAIAYKEPDVYEWVVAELARVGLSKRAIRAAAKAGDLLRANARAAQERRKDGRTLVTHQSGSPAVCVDEIEAAMLADTSQPPVFKYAGAWVSVCTSAPVTVRELASGAEYPAMPIIRRYDFSGLAERVSRSVRIEIRAHKQTPPKAIPPPEHLVRMLLSRQGGNAPTLTGIIEAPIVRRDGSVLRAEGYDAETGLFGMFNASAFSIPDTMPSQAEAQQARLFLETELFAEFPFQTDVDRAAAVAALITGLVRPVLGGAVPGFMLSSPTQSTGKTALAQAISHSAFGRPAAAQSYPGSDDEMSKLLLSVLAEGQRSIVFDNVPDGRIVDSSELASAMTSETYARRALGSHNNITVPTSVLWLITGNNLRLAGDLPSRFVEIYLDAASERPDQRTFKRVLVDWIGRYRPRIVAAAIAVVRAYIAADCPVLDGKPSRFREWDRMVRMPLIYAGGADVASKFDIAYANDPGLESLRDLLTQWQAVFPEPVTLREVLDKLDHGNGMDTNVDRFRDALHALLDDPRRHDITAKGVGAKLRRYLNRPAAGWKLRSKSTRTNTMMWWVESVE